MGEATLETLPWMLVAGAAEHAHAHHPARPGPLAGLTILWAGAHLLTAAITVGMLVSMSVPMFVAIKFFACLAVTVGAIVITVCWALRIARREHLVFATA